MSLAAIAFATATSFTQYPGVASSRVPVEVTIDKGPIVELIVRCRPGTGILSYSKIDRRFCSAKNRCFATFASAWRDTCR